MKILIVGAGSVGSVLAKLLARRGFHVTIATNDIPSAKKFLEHAPHIRLVEADARDQKSIIRHAQNANLLINAAHSSLNLSLMRTALKAHVNYMDLDSRLIDHKKAEQLGYAQRFVKEDIVALINAGVSPGLTNLMAAEAVPKFCGAAVSLKFRLLEDQDAQRLIPTWSPSVLKDELSARPLVFHHGKFGFTYPFRNKETFRFPVPFGERRVFSIFGDEIATVPLFLHNIHNADYKAGGLDIEMAMTGAEADSNVPTPDEMRQLVSTGVVKDARLIVSVRAIGHGHRPVNLHAVFQDIRHIMRRVNGATYIGYPTALCAAAFASVIPSLTCKGVIPTEALLEYQRKTVLTRLKKDGVRFTTTLD